MNISNIDAQTFYLNFWTAFNRYSLENKIDLNLKPKPSDYYYEFFHRLKGSSRFSIYIYPDKSQLNCSLYIPDDMSIFYYLKERRIWIESKLGALDWQELPDKKASRINQSIDLSFDLTDQSTWNISFVWLSNRLQDFQKVLIPHLQ